MARLIVISDVHGSMDALRTIEDRIDIDTVDRIVCLGDIVGYGPEPNEVISQLRDWGAECVLGNHDSALLGNKGVDIDNHFVGPNKELLLRSRDLIEPSNMKWLNQLPFVRENTIDGITYLASHSNPLLPTTWKRISDVEECLHLLNLIDERISICFIGHTHQSGVVTEQNHNARPARSPGKLSSTTDGSEVRKMKRMVANPGFLFHAKNPYSSPSFFILDTSSYSYSIEYFRYDLTNAAEKLKALHFPQKDIDALVGYPIL